MNATRLTRLFNVLDADGNGLLEAADFDRVATELTRSQALAEGSQASLGQRYRHLWETLAAACDANRDGRVTLQEWLAHHEALLDSDRRLRVEQPAYRSPIETTARFLFDVLDANQDGRISREEYRAFATAHGLSPDVADQAFEKVAPHGFLRREELVDMVLEFYFADEDCLGTWLFNK